MKYCDVGILSDDLNKKKLLAILENASHMKLNLSPITDYGADKTK
jgi:hypothetical protein